MLKVIRRTILCFTFLVISLGVRSQANIRNELTSQNQQAIRLDVEEKIRNFATAVKLLATSSDIVKIRFWRKQVDDYFLPNSTIIVSHVSQRGIFFDTLQRNTYFDRVLKLRGRYTVIQFDFTNIKASELTKHQDVNGKVYYTGNCRFVQAFRGRGRALSVIGESGTDFTYLDTTVKTVQIRIDLGNSIEGQKWKVRFGNIMVEETLPR